MNKIQLFPYQKRMKQAAYHFLKTGGKHAIICAAPRAGKTYTFASIAKDFNDHNKKVLILTDRTELLNQTGNSFKNLGLRPFYIQAGCQVVSNTHLSFVAMSQTLRNRIGQNYWNDFIKSMDLIIIDECHIQEFNYIFESNLLKNTWVLGFTGTPKRTGNMRQLGIDYEKIISEISISELLGLDRLVNCDVYGFEAPDITGVGINPASGDYKTSDLFNRFDKRNLYTGVVKSYVEICDNTKFMAYCVNKVHAIKTAIEFNEAGYNVKFIVSDTGKPKPLNCDANEGKKIRHEQNLANYDFYQKYFHTLSGSREKIFRDYHESKFLGLINVDIATKGYDCPDMQTVILNYKTISLTRYLQSAMRGATAYNRKTHYNLLDFGGNVAHFGMPLENRTYGLWHEKTDGNGLAPVKNCGYTSDGEPILNNGKGGCNRMILASMTICPFCGFKYPDKALIAGELQTLILNENKVVKTKLVKDMSLLELSEYRALKKHSQAWLWRQCWYRSGGNQKVFEKFGYDLGWGYGTIKKAISICKGY